MPQEVLKTTAPNYATHEHFICVGAGFGSHGSTRNAPKQTRQHLQKKQQQHFELRNRLAQINRGVTTHTTHHRPQTTKHTTHPTPWLSEAQGGSGWPRNAQRGPGLLRVAQGGSGGSVGAQVGSGCPGTLRGCPGWPKCAQRGSGVLSGDEKTDIVKWHTGQTLQNKCGTVLEQEPQSNTNQCRPPKCEIHIKNCLR